MLLYDKYLLLLNFIDCDINQRIWNRSEKSVHQFLLHSSQIWDSSSSVRWFFLCVSYKRSTLHLSASDKARCLLLFVGIP